VAKQPLKPGDTLDSIGGGTFYSLIDIYEVARQERLLPVGLAKGATLVRAVPQDQPITLDDVKLREPSTLVDLRKLQDDWMAGRVNEDVLAATLDQIAID